MQREQQSATYSFQNFKNFIKKYCQVQQIKNQQSNLQNKPGIYLNISFYLGKE